MYPIYRDIRSRLGEPRWHDSHGVPRYDEFHPALLDVYAEYAALSLIRCQSCGREFHVGVSWSIVTQVTIGTFGTPTPETIMPDGSFVSYGVHWDKNGENGKPVSMPSREDLGEFGYGDAPWHTIGDCQCAGTAMSTIEVGCIQFWNRSWRDPKSKHFGEWVRLPEYEIEIVEDGNGGLTMGAMRP